jgi:DNA-binding MarR family transcriptional regulator
VLQRLEQRRLVVRKADQGDRRRARLALTPRGRAVTTASQGTIEEVVSRVLREAPARQLASVGTLLQALVTALDPGGAGGGRNGG